MDRRPAMGRCATLLEDIIVGMVFGVVLEWYGTGVGAQCALIETWPTVCDALCEGSISIHTSIEALYRALAATPHIICSGLQQHNIKQSRAESHISPQIAF